MLKQSKSNVCHLFEFEILVKVICTDKNKATKCLEKITTKKGSLLIMLTESIFNFNQEVWMLFPSFFTEVSRV